MTKEMKEKTLREAMRNTKGYGYSILVGILFLIADLILIYLSHISMYNLIFALPILVFIRIQLSKWKIAKINSNLQRLILDPDFRKKYMEKNL